MRLIRNFVKSSRFTSSLMSVIAESRKSPMTSATRGPRGISPCVFLYQSEAVAIHVGFRLCGTRVLLPENRQISGLCAPSREKLRKSAEREMERRRTREEECDRYVCGCGVERDAHRGCQPSGKGQGHYGVSLHLRKSRRSLEEDPFSVHHGTTLTKRHAR